jgi:hypothetical protein
LVVVMIAVVVVDNCKSVWSWFKEMEIPQSRRCCWLVASRVGELKRAFAEQGKLKMRCA